MVSWRAPGSLRGPACGAALFYDPEQTGQGCWNCSGSLPVPVTLKLRGGLLVLSEGAVLTSHHLNRDRDHRTACAVTEPHPRQPGHVVLRNLTEAELHDLLEMVQGELLHRPGHDSPRTVAVVKKDEGALLNLYRGLSTSQRGLLWRMARYVGASAAPVIGMRA